MRFKLTLSIDKRERGNILPFNYQYELSSWIYKVLNEGDPIFSAWLHSQGYKTKEKPFRLFTFSNLLIESYKPNNDRMIINTGQADLIISFLPTEAISPFILGLFKDRHLVIGDKQSQVAFNVTAVESLPPITFMKEMTFKTISPLFVDDIDHETGHKNYLSPESSNYSNLIHNNLLEKYRAFYKQDPDDAWPETKIEVIGTSKSKKITIKAGTDQSTELKAYLFTFHIKGCKELLEVGYYGGFGRENSQGFGCVEEIKKIK
ncbi:MAG: CRISPR-associated endoribonuclease Cas6 [Lentimicrobiaceae bacterium]